LVRQFQALALDKKAIGQWRIAGKRSANQKARIAEKTLAAQKKSRLPLQERKRRKHQIDSLNALRSVEPKIHFGTVASGSLVVASKQMQARLLTLHGKIAASEMEGAGMLAQTFTHEMPTPAILIKGISDYADPKKGGADDVGYWRSLACENSIRLALAVMRRGRIRPVNTDQFVLDQTCGPIEVTRSYIPEPASPGNSLRGFPALVQPKGPITSIRLSIRATTNNGMDLNVHKLVVSFVSLETGQRTDVNWPPGEPINLAKLASEWVGLYLMLAGKPAVIQFSAKTPVEEQTTQWVQPAAQGEEHG
jgi:hypothetical protein